MSSDDDTTAKKRKAIANDDDVEGLESSASAAAIMAEMKAHMTRMQNEMTQHLQNEIDGMKSRLSKMDGLERKCQLYEGKYKKLEAKCDSLERSVQILMKESKWEYSAPSVPESYWEQRGFYGQYIDDMEYLLDLMKNRTIALRSGKCKYNIDLCGFIEETDETILLRHDDVLLPHWKEFANALQLYHNPSRLLKLSICKVQLTSSVIDLLATVLKGKTILESFQLDSNEFGNTREGIGFAVEIVGGNPNLEDFHWGNNDIETMEDARYLVDAIICHPLIHRIRIENCFGEDINGYEILCSFLASDRNFLHIDFEKNNIRTGGSTEIPDYLATNPPLKTLYLAGNHLDDNDAILIASALKQNTNLQCLRLGDNELTENGKNALSNAIYDSTSLNSVVDCNHTCSITGIDLGDIPVNILHLNTPKVNRARKIYHLLSERNREWSNVHHLNHELDDEDDSLALVPNVLASVQQYCRGARFSRDDFTHQAVVHPLSIMYEILRSWKMPQLYE